ncbi:hypothetical protein [Dictyobacter kobayashii]|uniref:Uncharacterized protein n=1 Tax=Dictyobacter kobayashii TaxID=2014872 RepID=A0A402AYM0_9CHLR|nr:hypothetical protein [Dictyobacter kobayashii]GCE24194.1 hypothetical protein KDK_79940 [Dictyobacter kobayashii]
MQAPVKASEITPQSALRHRRISPQTEEVRFVQPRASLTRTKQEPHTTGGPASVNKLAKPVQQQQQSQQRYTSNMHWSLPVGLAMIGMLVVLWLGQQAVMWGTTAYDDLRYGRPRTVQADAFVGHESGKTPSHFIALNDHGRVEIIEFPGGDPAHSRIFMGPQIWETMPTWSRLTLILYHQHRIANYWIWTSHSTARISSSTTKRAPS